MMGPGWVPTNMELEGMFKNKRKGNIDKTTSFSFMRGKQKHSHASFNLPQLLKLSIINRRNLEGPTKNLKGSKGDI